MTRRLIAVLAVVMLMGVVGCGKAKVAVTDADRSLAEKIGMPEAFLAEIKGAGKNLRQLQGMSVLGDAAEAPGVTIDVPEDLAISTVKRLQASAPPGWMAFVSDYFGPVGGPDQVSVLKAADLGDVIMTMGTNGINYGIEPEMIVTRLKDWEHRFGIVLQGAGFDWLEASFGTLPPDMLAFAQEVYAFCPDVVDQGTGTVEALAEEMKQFKSVYLWWD